MLARWGRLPGSSFWQLKPFVFKAQKALLADLARKHSFSFNLLLLVVFGPNLANLARLDRFGAKSYRYRPLCTCLTKSKCSLVFTGLVQWLRSDYYSTFTTLGCQYVGKDSSYWSSLGKICKVFSPVSVFGSNG